MKKKMKDKDLLFEDLDATNKFFKQIRDNFYVSDLGKYFPYWNWLLIRLEKDIHNYFKKKISIYELYKQVKVLLTEIYRESIEFEWKMDKTKFLDRLHQSTMMLDKIKKINNFDPEMP